MIRKFGISGQYQCGRKYVYVANFVCLCACDRRYHTKCVSVCIGMCSCEYVRLRIHISVDLCVGGWCRIECDCVSYPRQIHFVIRNYALILIWRWQMVRHSPLSQGAVERKFSWPSSPCRPCSSFANAENKTKTKKKRQCRLSAPWGGMGSDL